MAVVIEGHCTAQRVQTVHPLHIGDGSVLDGKVPCYYSQVAQSQKIIDTCSIDRQVSLDGIETG